MKSKLLPVLLLLALAAIACNASSITDITDGVTIPNGDDSAAPEDTSVLFSDDFSDVNSGWDRTSSESGSTDYENGGYRIYVSAENYYAWANPGLDFTDVSITVEATKIGGDDDNEYGIICRHANVDNFYLATISSDGYFGFWKSIDGSPIELISMENMLSTEAINLGDTSNTIRLDCIGPTLSLYINGSFIADEVDDSISSGDVGLHAGTFSVPETEIIFDNFVVRSPQ